MTIQTSEWSLLMEDMIRLDYLDEIAEIAAQIPPGGPGVRKTWYDLEGREILTAEVTRTNHTQVIRKLMAQVKKSRPDRILPQHCIDTLDYIMTFLHLARESHSY